MTSSYIVFSSSETQSQNVHLLLYLLDLVNINLSDLIAPPHPRFFYLNLCLRNIVYMFVASFRAFIYNFLVNIFQSFFQLTWAVICLNLVKSACLNFLKSNLKT